MHIYEDQVELMRDVQLKEPYLSPKLEINPNIKSLKIWNMGNVG